MNIYSLLPVLAFATLSAAAQVPVPAPGLTIPSGSIPYALDHYAGAVELVPVHHSVVEVNNHKGANIAGGAFNPFFKQKMTTELAGAHARTVIHDTTPSFFLLVVRDPGGDDESLVFGVVRAVVDHPNDSNAHRIFAQVRQQQLTKNSQRNDGLVETTVEKLPGGWLKLTPTAPMAPGEYAISQIPKSQSTFAAEIYDFTLDPAAPNAADAIMAKP